MAEPLAHVACLGYDPSHMFKSNFVANMNSHKDHFTEYMRCTMPDHSRAVGKKVSFNNCGMPALRLQPKPRINQPRPPKDPPSSPPMWEYMRFNRKVGTCNVSAVFYTALKTITRVSTWEHSCNDSCVTLQLKPFAHRCFVKNIPTIYGTMTHGLCLILGLMLSSKTALEFRKRSSYASSKDLHLMHRFTQPMVNMRLTLFLSLKF